MTFSESSRASGTISCTSTRSTLRGPAGGLSEMRAAAFASAAFLRALDEFHRKRNQILMIIRVDMQAHDTSTEFVGWSWSQHSEQFVQAVRIYDCYLRTKKAMVNKTVGIPRSTRMAKGGTTVDTTWQHAGVSANDPASACTGHNRVTIASLNRIQPKTRVEGTPGWYLADARHAWNPTWNCTNGIVQLYGTHKSMWKEGQRDQKAEARRHAAIDVAPHAGRSHGEWRSSSWR